MIPYDIDPTLHSAQPGELLLDDGFSAPRGDSDATEAPSPPATRATASLDQALASKSDF